MAYIIKIKGRADTIMVEHAKGDKIKSSWFSWIQGGKKMENDTLFDLGSYSGMLSQIHSMEKYTDTKIDPKQHVSYDSEKEYVEERNKFLSRTLEQKANDMHFFGILFWSFTNTVSISDAIMRKVVELQKKFYEENPNRMISDPTIYKSLFKGNVMNRFGASLIERIVREDKFHENK